MKIFTVFLLILFSTSSFSQSDWVNYIVKKENGLMSVSVDLSNYDYKPNYKNLLIVGTNYKNCLKNGFPKEEGLEELYKFSDSTAIIIDKLTKNKLVGIITSQCIGLDIYYVKDTTNIRDNFNDLFEKHFNNSQNYLMITKDKGWEYYYKNIYPINVTNDYFMDQEYLLELATGGDKLNGARKVEHWMYFSKVKNRSKFMENAKEFDFTIDSVHTKSKSIYMYEVMISRKDSVHPESIYKLNRLVKSLVHLSKGIYGGWGTEAKIED